MTFLGLAFLTALPLIAVPLVLHFFDRRRRVLIEWGAMRFLQEAVAGRARRRRLQQWLLLLMRMIAIAALVLALAQPVAPGTLWGSGKATETIYIVDNSASMSRSINGSTLFEFAIARIAEELGDSPPDNLVRFMLSSPGPEWLNPTAVRVGDRSEQLLGELKQLKPNGSNSNLLASLFAAAQADVPTSVIGRQVVIVTDNQASDWQLQDRDGWRGFRESLLKADAATEVRVLAAAETPGELTNNIAVTDIESSSGTVGAAEICRCSATFQSYSDDLLTDLKIKWLVNGQVQHVDQVDELEAYGSREVQYDRSFGATGSHLVSCQVLYDDALAADNENTIVVEVVDRIPVLIVIDSPPYGEIESDSWFIEAALGRIGDDQDWTSVFEPSVVQSTELGNTPLGEFRAIVIPSLAELPRESIAQLAEFVQFGGGLWIALGPRTDIRSFNRLWHRDMVGLVPLAIDRVVVNAATDPDGEFGINPLLPEHAATRQLADVQRLDLGDIKVSHRHRFSVHGDSVHSTLLETVDGEPLAVETTFGSGRIIVMSLPLRLQWSTLVLSRSFVVMVQDWLTWLSEPAIPRQNLSPGEPISLLLGGHAGLNNEATIIAPDGKDLVAEASDTPRGPAVRLRPRDSGTYWLTPQRSDQSIAFHVKRPVAESNLAQLGEKDQHYLADTVGIHMYGGPEVAVPLDARWREPLWPFLLGLLTCVISVELLMSVLMAQQRAGVVPAEKLA